MTGLIRAIIAPIIRESIGAGSFSAHLFQLNGGPSIIIIIIWIIIYHHLSIPAGCEAQPATKNPTGAKPWG